MGWVNVAVAVGTFAYGLYSGNKSEDAAKKAAEDQKIANQEAAKLIYPATNEMLGQVYNINEHNSWVNQGLRMNAIGETSNMMANAASSSAGMLSEGYLKAGNISNAAAQSAAGAAMSQANESSQLQKEMYDEYALQASPWATAGRRALSALEERPDFEFKPEDFNFQADPSYDWRKSQGMSAIDKSGSARGRSLSGAQDKALMEYGQGMASQEYQASFNRHWGEQVNRYNMASGEYNINTNVLQGISQQGLNAAKSIGQAGMNYATNVGNIMGRATEYAGNARMEGANALAAGEVGSAGALANGVMQSTGFRAGGINALAEASITGNNERAAASGALLSGRNEAYTNYVNGIYGAESKAIEQTAAADQAAIENRNTVVQGAIKNAGTIGVEYQKKQAKENG